MATDALLNILGCSIIGQAQHKAGVLSFNIDGHSAQEIAEGLNAGVLQSDRGIIVLNLSCVDLELKSLRVHLLQFITLLKMLKDL
jgi:selenocysteine lyase/cysteine desulfurase